MGGAIRLFTVRGIPIRMHITFPLILVFAAFWFAQGRTDWLQGATFGVVVTVLLFAGVVLHELAHSLVAMAFGTRVKEIVLLPLGGVAQMERVPERPYQELLMAVSGPLTSGAIGIALAAAVPILFPVRGIEIWRGFQEAFLDGQSSFGWEHLLPYLSLVNLFLAIFNMIPAFPMDGGRVLRALLAAVIPYGRATAIAVTIGQGLAFLIGLLGLLEGDILLILVAIFVYSGAAQEGQMVQVKVALGGLQVRQAFSRHAQLVHPDEPLGRAVDLTLDSFQSDFPVCDGERLVGLLTRTDLLAGLKAYGPQAPIDQVMHRQLTLVHPDDDLFAAQQAMNEARLEAAVVIDGDTFLGLLTRQDLEEVYRLVSIHPALLRRREWSVVDAQEHPPIRVDRSIRAQEPGADEAIAACR